MALDRAQPPYTHASPVANTATHLNSRDIPTLSIPTGTATRPPENENKFALIYLQMVLPSHHFSDNIESCCLKFQDSHDTLDVYIV